jgi:hypothetical protein
MIGLINVILLRMKHTHKLFFFLFLCPGTAFSQISSYSDPASAYMRILLEKSGEGSYQRIGTFKVIGTPYLYGPKLNGNVYTATERGKNIQLSFNTYNQQLEIYQNGQNNPLIKTAMEVDSFQVLSNADIKDDMLFVSSNIVDLNAKKCFFVEVYKGNRFSLYKLYKSELGYVSTNYVQSELRQFDLNYEYYYKDTAKAGIKKMKINSKYLKGEFKDISDISAYVNADEFTTNTEYQLKKIFAALNTK